MGFGFGFSFGVFDILFTVIFLIIFLVIVITFATALIKAIRQKRRDDRSPRLTVTAAVVTKRTDVSHHSGSVSGEMSRTNTTYYVTFQVASGDRLELQVDGYNYGMLVEGDRGELSFQGSRFLDFARA